MLAIGDRLTSLGPRSTAGSEKGSGIVELETREQRVWAAVRHGPWLEVFEELSACDPIGLTAVELEALAESAWWLCRADASIAARHRAYAAFRDAGDDRGAARTASRLFHEHFYRGERAVAVG